MAALLISSACDALRASTGVPVGVDHGAHCLIIEAGSHQSPSKAEGQSVGVISQEGPV